MKPAVLYISYDGMLEPLGQSQVLAYLQRLSPSWSIHLVSFEKETDRNDKARMQAMRERMGIAGISWTPLAYHKTPSAPATAYDIAVGTSVAIWLARKHKISIVHARSYVPALMALAVKRLTGVQFLFDMRGFWADERVDGGLWPADGRLYRTTKALERRFIEAADHMITLTHASAREIAKFPYLAGRDLPLTVIPTCADLDGFSPQPADPNRPFTFGYVGSIGTWYLFEETLAVFRAIKKRRADAKMLVVNRNEHERIRTMVQAAGLALDDVGLVAAEHHDVPSLIARMNVGGALIKPSYSKIASAPTKLAEYLGCGVPCLGNINVGDMEEILEGRNVGVALRDFKPEDIENGAERVLALASDRALSARCVAVARELFSLEGGVMAYRQIYEALAAAASRRHAGSKPETAKS